MSYALEDIVMEGLKHPGSSDLQLQPSHRRVRAFFNDVAIGESQRAVLLYEPKHLPVYYFPVDDVRMDLLTATTHRTRCPLKGEASYWTITVGDRTTENAVWGYANPLPTIPEIKDYVAFYWNAMDAWFEEDDEVFVHPRDPYHRVDVLHTSRHVRVVFAGEAIADTRQPRMLLETGLPARYYIPKVDVRMDLLEPTDTSTSCPYKGTSRYWSIVVGDKVGKDLAWSYPFPIPECPKIENLVCFFNERVDEIYVDGELQDKPKTPWS